MSTKVEASVFSQKTADVLKNAGFAVATSEGLSIQDQRDKGRKFWSRVHEGDSRFEALTCEPSQFAYHPEQFILPKSEGKSLAELAKMLQKMENQLRKGLHIPGDYRVVPFTMQEVVGLLYEPREDGKYLMSDDIYTWTSTNYTSLLFYLGQRINKDQVVVVGLPTPSVGPSVSLWLSDQTSARIGIAAKVVPV